MEGLGGGCGGGGGRGAGARQEPTGRTAIIGLLGGGGGGGGGGKGVGHVYRHSLKAENHLSG